jgi:hypothetical protein
VSLLSPAWKKLDPADLRRLHVEQRLTYQQVAETLGTTRDVVRYAMDRHRLPRWLPQTRRLERMGGGKPS